MIFLTLLKESLFFAWHALMNNKLRTFLSLLGITIGIFAIITVFTIVDSLENNIRGSVASLGDNVVYVQKMPWIFDDDVQWWKIINRPSPVLKELEAIKLLSQKSAYATFHVNVNKTIKQGNNSIQNATISGVSTDYEKVTSFEIEKGRYFSDIESATGKNVVVIGDKIAEALFQKVQSPIGQHITIAGRKIEVIGVVKKQGESIMGNSMDSQVLLPLNFIRNFTDLRSESSYPFIVVKARPGISNEELKDELTSIMRAARRIKPIGEDNFALNEIKLLSAAFDEMFGVIGLAGWIIGGFSILVGGFGIANIMFVSVRERTNLIGIQKSLGAKNYFILLQFLIESILLSLLGGIIGLLIIFVVTLLAGDAFGMAITLSRSNIILGLTISFLIGIVSGFIPAYGASQMDPVDAIRSN